MKRYVKELANNIITSDAKNEMMRPEIKKERKATIEHYVSMCQDGLITDCEAVYGISKLNVSW